MSEKNYFEILEEIFDDLITEDILRMISYAYMNSTTHAGCFIALDGLNKLLKVCIAESQAGRSFNKIHDNAMYDVYAQLYNKWFILRDRFVEIEEVFPSDLNYDQELNRIFLSLSGSKKREILTHLMNQVYVNIQYIRLKVSDSLPMRLIGSGYLCKFLINKNPNSLFFLTPEDWLIIQSACNDYKRAWSEEQWQMLGINKAEAKLADYIIEADLAVPYSWCMTVLPIMKVFSKGGEPDWEITMSTVRNLVNYFLNRDSGKFRSIGIIDKEDRFLLALEIIKEGHPINKLLYKTENSSIYNHYFIYENYKFLLGVECVLKRYFYNLKNKKIMYNDDVGIENIRELLRNNSLGINSYNMKLLNNLPSIIKNLRKFPKREAWRKEFSLKPFIIGAGTYLALAFFVKGEAEMEVLSSYLLQTVTTGLSTEIYHLLYEVPGSVKKRLEFERLSREMRSQRSET